MKNAEYLPNLEAFSPWNTYPVLKGDPMFPPHCGHEMYFYWTKELFKLNQAWYAVCSEYE